MLIYIAEGMETDDTRSIRESLFDKFIHVIYRSST